MTYKHFLVLPGLLLSSLYSHNNGFVVSLIRLPPFHPLDFTLVVALLRMITQIFLWLIYSTFSSLLQCITPEKPSKRTMLFLTPPTFCCLYPNSFSSWHLPFCSITWNYLYLWVYIYILLLSLSVSPSLCLSIFLSLSLSLSPSPPPPLKEG